MAAMVESMHGLVMCVVLLNSEVEYSQDAATMQIFAVCPFLAFDNQNSRQRFLRLVTRHPRILGAASALLGRLPSALKRCIVTSYASALEPHALGAALGLLQWRPAVNALTLAKHEFIDLGSPADWWLLKYFGKHPRLLYKFASTLISRRT